MTETRKPLRGGIVPLVCALLAEGWNLLFLWLWEWPRGAAAPWHHLAAATAGYLFGWWFAASLRGGHYGLPAGMSAGIIVGGINGFVVYDFDGMIVGAVIGIVPGLVSALLLAPIVRRFAA